MVKNSTMIFIETQERNITKQQNGKKITVCNLLVIVLTNTEPINASCFVLVEFAMICKLVTIKFNKTIAILHHFH